MEREGQRVDSGRSLKGHLYTGWTRDLKQNGGHLRQGSEMVVHICDYKTHTLSKNLGIKIDFNLLLCILNATIPVETKQISFQRQF